MNKLATIIWVIGWLYTSGYALYRMEGKKHPLQIVAVSAVIWPMLLGVETYALMNPETPDE